MVLRAGNLNRFESLGFHKNEKGEFEGIYRNYKCSISFKKIGFGLAPTLFITVFFDIKVEDDNAKYLRLEELAKKYRIYTFKWHYNALSQIWTFNIFMPKFEKMLLNLNTLIDILNTEGLDPKLGI